VWSPEPQTDRVRAAELIAALCPGTDLGTGFPFEHGLHTTLIAIRLADRLDVDAVAAVIAAGRTAGAAARAAGRAHRTRGRGGGDARPGLQTKQVAHALGISVKTADRHIQNAYEIAESTERSAGSARCR
jgi:hypothetical protein